MKSRIQLIGIFVLAMLLFTVKISANSNYLFKHIDSNNNLASSNVKCIIQDSYGFMWFGTKHGLNRYDGVLMRQLNCYDNERNQGNNNIGALYEDPQKKIWVGTDRGVYIYDPQTDKFKALVAADPKTGNRASNWVQTIDGDEQGNTWVLLPDQGVFRYDASGKASFYNITSKSGFKESYPSNLCVDSHGDVWVSTIGVGIYKYDKRSQTFKRLVVGDGNDLQKIRFSVIKEESDGILIFGSDIGELFRYNVRNNTITPITHSNTGKIYLRSLECFDDEIWIGAQTGVYVLDKSTGHEKILTHDPVNRFSLSDDAAYYIYKDKDGDAWVGTIFGGANYMIRNKFYFDIVGAGARNVSHRIRGIAQTSNGHIWIGTENGGLNEYDPVTKVMKRVAVIPSSHNIALCVKTYNDKLYVCFNNYSIDLLSTEGAYEGTLVDSNIGMSTYAFLKDSKGNEWIGKGSALYRRDAGGNEFKHITNTGYDWIFDIYESSDGDIWICTMGNGLWRYKPLNGQFKSYIYNEKEPNGLRSNSISSALEDHKGNIWFTTDRGGISRYNKDTDDFTSYGMAEGLPDDVAYDMIEDKNGYLWFGTNKGLVKFNPETMDIRVFTTKDGLVGNQFNYHSALKANNGMFYFGGIDGLICFNPELEEKQISPAPLYFTRLSVLNKECKVGEPNSPLKKNIMFSDEIELSYDQTTFSLDVVSPNFGIAGDGSYSYKLTPGSSEWIPLNNNYITFTNLPPGKYKLVVKVSNNVGTSERTLSIIILPPWWRSTWALIIYFLLAVLGFYLWFLWYREHKNKQLSERQELFTANKEKELYRSKVKFFTEIAHEIRTPLTLIEAPLEAVEEFDIKDKRMAHYLNIVRQNTKRLLDLTGNLLDFQKIDSNKLTLKYENVDVISLVNELIDRFEPTITLRQKEIKRNIENDVVIASTDKEAVTKVLSNLMLNALKYSRHRIEVNLTSDEQDFRITVKSDGERIADEERKRIFEQFYQVENRENHEDGGVGIGLSLSQSLVVLLKGTLELEDNYEDGMNSFVVTLPLNKEDIKRNNVTAIDAADYLMDEESNLSQEKTNGYTVLLVEDNDVMREFLAEQLAHSFTIETARNGKEAIDILNSTHVDIITTDIMMPEMDGFELCKVVKADINLSHIPIVFITAKNDLDSKINGLQYGAEGYIEKPFSVKYFKHLISSLLDNRRREREAFSKKPFFTVENMQTNKADEEFMNKVVKIIEEHICEENFNVEIMAEMFCMSRSSLLRKIKTLFNLLPVELIRLIKLKKAAELIREGNYLISDICYMVGITSPSYFSKLFSKQFGIAPKDFEKQCRKKDGGQTLSEDKQTKNM